MNPIVSNIIGIRMSNTANTNSFKTVTVHSPMKVPIAHVVIAGIVNNTLRALAFFRAMNVVKGLLVVYLKVKWICFHIVSLGPCIVRPFPRLRREDEATHPGLFGWFLPLEQPR